MGGWLLAVVGVLVAVPLDLALVALWPSLQADSQFGLVAAGVAGGVFSGGVFASRVPFLLVLDHELAHLLAAVLCLRRPVGLQVGEETGLAEYSHGRGRNLILLAPYGWPWLAWALCALHQVVRIELREPVAVAIGVALGFSLVRVALDLRPYQTDLQRVGLVRSALCVLAWSPLLYAGPTLWALGGWAEIQAWGVAATAELARWSVLLG